MANTAQAKKRVRQAEAKRQKNTSQRSSMRTHLKKARALADAGTDNAQLALRQAMSAVDTLAAKGLIHKNKAARHKSRLNACFKKSIQL